MGSPIPIKRESGSNHWHVAIDARIGERVDDYCASVGMSRSAFMAAGADLYLRMMTHFVAPVTVHVPVARTEGGKINRPPVYIPPPAGDPRSNDYFDDLD